MFKTLLTNQLPSDSLLSSAHLDSLARENLFIQRKSSKLSASGIVHSLLSSVIDGNSSFADIGLNLGDYEQVSISKQAIHQRLDQTAVDFMKNINASLLTQKYSQAFPLKSSLFKRILIEDASLVPMHDSNSKDFRAFGNRRGDSAAYKIDFCYDFISAKPISTELINPYDNDKKAGSRLINDHVRKGDLILRDMGYYSQKNFQEITSIGASWLSKLPTNVNVSHEGVDLNEIIKKTQLDRLDIEVELSMGAFKARLIACRATPKQAEEKRRRANRQAQTHGKTPRKNASLRNGWHITITNVAVNQMSTQEVVDLYRLRWQIETVFKAWKQSSNLRKCFDKKSNAFHQQCLIQASLLLLLLTMKFVVILQSKSPHWLSVLKVAKTLGHYIRKLRILDEVALFDPDPRYTKMEQRNRSNLMELAKSCLA